MMQLAVALDSAVERGEIEAWFQPQLDLGSGQIIGAEALCRWIHPELGPIAPSVFIPLAEETGAILEIGSFMMQESCRTAEELSRYDTMIGISVNVSPLQLKTSALTDYLADQLALLSLPERALTVEITEARPIADLPVVVGRLDELRDLGLGVSLDDYGVGHSSLKQLRRLHATELKIDRSLIIDESPELTLELAAVIRSVHETGAHVVAEGVETPAHLQRVRDLGCDRAQGYLIGRPQPKTALVELLTG